MTELEQEAIPVSLRFSNFSCIDKKRIQHKLNMMNASIELYQLALKHSSLKDIGKARKTMLNSIKEADLSLDIF